MSGDKHKGGILIDATCLYARQTHLFEIKKRKTKCEKHNVHNSLNTWDKMKSCYIIVTFRSNSEEYKKYILNFVLYSQRSNR